MIKRYGILLLISLAVALLFYAFNLLVFGDRYILYQLIMLIVFCAGVVLFKLKDHNK